MSHIACAIHAQTVADCVLMWMNEMTDDAQVAARLCSVDALMAVGHQITRDDLILVYAWVLRQTSPRRTLPLPTQTTQLIRRLRAAVTVTTPMPVA
jgi:hypothetical protein